MTTYYRFRPVDKLLDGYKELETQTIYFAEPEDLNDPMEGLSVFYWKGDEVVWSRFFEHFLRCAMYAVGVYALREEVAPITWEELPWRDPASMPPIPIVKTIDRLVDSFLQTPNMQKLIPHLARRLNGVFEEELHTHLRWIHTAAVGLMQEALIDENILAKGGVTTIAPPMVDPLLDGLDLMSDVADDEAIRKFFNLAGQVFDLQTLRNVLDAPTDVKPNRRFIYLDFPQRYLGVIRRLVHPEWSTACFMDNYANMSVWGHYGHNHTGVCLMFKAQKDHGRDGLFLHAPVAANASGPQWMKFFFPFQKVDYGAKVTQVNFFTALGKLPAGVVRNFWYTDKVGKTSTLVAEVFDRVPAWQEEYWTSFVASVTRKFIDWSYEREYRLIFWSSINDLKPKPMRTLKYDFDDLEGIIFGIKTPDAEKLRIIRYILDKCAATGRTTFEFYQATRAENPDRIDVTKLDLLRAKP